MADTSAEGWLHLFAEGPWTTELAEGSLGADAYVGSYPPAGARDHVCQVTVYALAEDPSGMKTSLNAPCDPKALEKELESCGILASGTWEGRYANRDNSE